MLVDGVVPTAARSIEFPRWSRGQLSCWVADAVTCRLYGACQSAFDVGAGRSAASFPSWAVGRVEGALWRAQGILSPGSLCVVRRVGSSTLYLSMSESPHDELPAADPDDLWVEVVATVPDVEGELPGIETLERARASLAAKREVRRQGRFVVVVLALGATSVDIVSLALKERTETHRWTQHIVRRPDGDYVPIEVVAWEV